MDAWRFRAARADYYAYLAEVLVALRGRKTLLDLFEDDARRYGAATVRGRLAQRWARRYQESGGDLAAAWADALPADECLLVASAQAAGGEALAEVLRDLARAVRLVRGLRDELTVTLAAGLAALGVAIALLCAVPYFTVPRLQHVFQGLPPEYLGPLTRRLYALADAVRRLLPLWSFALPAGALLVLWSLPNFTGRTRPALDGWAVWRLYRDFHAVRFLAMLSVLLRQRGNIDTRLREALAIFAWNARPWLAGHVTAMLARIDAGIVGEHSLDTGLFDRELWWFMADMIAAHGLAGGLQQARARIESHTVARVRRQAQAARWLLLLGATGAVLGLALWHYAVIDELRRALTQFHASR
ncbi:general secretion pathway protein [Bordetella genomosp. 13]|uniref:general secretion pathway protein n=1 Tax=Bordetella genomosp. 13 TaxID=463040 RepID=UPI00119EAC3F|nr:general secretion pathway protein [Bordetella genomosp. 13]